MENITPPIFSVRKASERGQADHGWLKSQHSFSFASYYDEAHMGFRSLRVINTDWVAAGQGFGMHTHQNMEIFSYVTDGILEHKDSLGNGSQLEPGHIQLMSAGSGVAHSEFNASKEDPLQFLQIWITPNQHNLTPGYTEWHPQPNQVDHKKVLIISADGRDGSALIHQDASIYLIQLAAGESLTHELTLGRGAWLQVIEGTATANDAYLTSGDGAHIDESGLITLQAETAVEALLFDLA